jgi:tRNA threonylcarbamoyladenosine biosynthesis protein TsaE
LQLILNDATDTEALGSALWDTLPENCLLFLYGDLGAGKTTLMRGLLRAAGYSRPVKSPTYSLVEEYEVAGRQIIHFDLYRLRNPEELEWMGMADYLRQPALCCIEWPQMGAGYLPAADIEIHFVHLQHSRMTEINIIADTLKNKLTLHWKNKDILL